MQPHKPILYGPDGLPIVRARSIHAPKPRIGAGLEGWVSWRLIDRRGREVDGGEQHNLILNGFLDALAVTECLPIGTLLSHFAVGTGSTTPATTDTALATEISGRATTSITSSVTRTANGVYDSVIEREFNFAQGNGNLTEFGFANGASGAILVRELFRDGGGSPITVTKTSDYKLRIKYTLTLTFSPVTATAGSFAISGIGSIGGSYMWVGGSALGADSYGALDYRAFSRTARSLVYPKASATVHPLSYTSDAAFGGSIGTRVYDAYVPGSYERSMSGEWGTGVANTTIASIGVMGDNYDNQQRAGFVFVIDSDDRFTKDSLHMLTIDDLITVAWARA